MRFNSLKWAFVLLFTATLVGNLAAQPGRVVLPGQMPAIAAGLTPQSRLPASNQLQVTFTLPLRNEAALDGLLGELYDPGSTNFHKFLTPSEFTARFGPTENDYQAVIAFARAYGLTVTGRHSNRVVLDVSGSASDIERAFGVTLQVYRHPTEPRNFYAPDRDPSVPTNVPVANLWGLNDYVQAIPLLHQMPSTTSTPLNYNGSAPGGAYQGHDFRNAYVPGTILAGSGQTVAVAEFDGYYANDITTYEAYCGYTNVPLNNILVGVNGQPSNNANQVAEVSLDIEMAISMAPALSQVMVYEGSNPYDVFNKIATDNLAGQISCSWAWGTGPSHTWIFPHGSGTTLDSQLKQMAAQGQSFFEASGDSDAYTGKNAMTSNAGPIPVDSIYVTSVGGTSLTMNGTGASWASETNWNWGNNTGSGGGVSPNYYIPSWQTNVNVSPGGGSATNRNIPDVAMTADAVYVVYNDGSSNIFGGTSCAAPLWAGFTALVNQQAISSGNAPVGFLNPSLYNIAASASYAACFHDITIGNNIGANTPGLYNAISGYDLCTGLGTPNGVNLIYALLPAPYILTPPANQTATNGNNVTLSAAASGKLPLSYRWLFNSTNLPRGGNVSGVASNVLTITAVTLANAGNYSVVLTNSYGSVTSSVAVLTVVWPPSFSLQPTNQTILTGSNVVFNTTVSGGLPLTYQWQQNNTNLTNSGNVSGANTNRLMLTAITANNGGDYMLIATNIYGSVTSSVAVLNVVSVPTIAVPPTNQTVQCGGNASFSLSATGTGPLNYHWTLDGAAIPGATNTTLLLTSVHMPNHTVQVVVTNPYNSATSTVSLFVVDSLPPVITLNSTNPFYVEAGKPYVEPGATASDSCAGSVPVSISGAVNTSAASTNIITYTATDGNGNTNTVTRTVIVWQNLASTLLNLVSSENPSGFKDGFTLTANVTPASAGGTIQFLTNGAPFDLESISTGQATSTNLSLLPRGTNVITAIYSGDASDLPATNTLSQVVTNHPPTASAVYYTNTPGIMLVILITNLAAAWSDPDGDTVSLATASVSTNGIIVTDTGLALLYFNTNNVADQFMCTITDGCNGTNFQTVYIEPPPPNPTPYIEGISISKAGGVTLSLLGAPGNTYVVQTSTNLDSSSWLPIATNTLGSTNNSWQFTDPAATNITQQFYRVMLSH